jgi:glycosyltransferase 2 family protein
MSAARGKSLSRRILQTARVLAPWVAITCVVLALGSQADQLRRCLERLNPWLLALASLFCILYRVFNAGVWVWILAALGHRIPYLQGTRAWLTSESLRWLPGSIWGFCSRVDAAKNLGVPATVASISLPVELAVTIISWTIVAFVGLLVSGLGARLLATYAIWVMAVGGLAILLLLTVKLTGPILARQRWFISAFARVRGVLKVRPNPAALFRAALFYTALNAANGLGLWLILFGMGYSQVVSPAAAIGVNAAGWLVGFFAIGVPGGIGVRESASALLLAPFIPWQEAILASVLWRLIQIVAEFGSLLPCLFLRQDTARTDRSALRGTVSL